MTRSKFTLLLGTLLFSVGVDLRAQTAGERVESHNIRLTFTAVDKHNSPFTTLLKEDIQILEDGSPQQITALERESDVPLELSFLIDVSASQMLVIPETRAVAISFAKSVLRPGRDSGSVATFAGHLWVKQAPTSDLNEVQSALEQLKYVSPTDSKLAKSAIWEAACVASEQMFRQASANSRRVMILMTDGEDTLSQKARGAAIDCASKANVTIYVIGLIESEREGLGESSSMQRKVLRELSESTGGSAFFHNKDNGFGSTIAQIQRELRFQYVVTYSSSSQKPRDSSRQVVIEVINSEKKKEKPKLRYAKEYFPTSR